MRTQDSRLIWIDLEMTGLDSQRDSIIEIATIVTGVNLEVIEEGPVFAICQSEELMNGMDEWNTRQHGQSGLTERVRSSRTTLAEAEQGTLEFLRQHVSENSSPMCGNSICQDRRFLAREMPALEKFFHYRNLDVSTLKILAGLWAQDILAGIEKKSQHLALADIRDSIAELAHYRDHFLNAGAGGDLSVD